MFALEHSCASSSASCEGCLRAGMVGPDDGAQNWLTAAILVGRAVGRCKDSCLFHPGAAHSYRGYLTSLPTFPPPQIWGNAGPPAAGGWRSFPTAVTGEGGGGGLEDW